MNKQGKDKFGLKADGRIAKGASGKQVEQTNLESQARRERNFELFLAGVLLAFGVYQSILFYGYTAVPNGDFPCFFQTGKEILSLKMPTSFKRVPVLGILQVILSHFVGGQHPDLTAGWLLNAVLHPFNLLLLWLVGKRIVGRAGLWVAIAAIINPQVVYLLTEPLAETTLLFFILLTVYLIFRRSNWCYLFASITTMTRYEGAALILAAFVMDLIQYKDRQHRIRALIYAILAGIPLALWMFGTFLNWRAEGSHYLSVFGQEYNKFYDTSAEARTGLLVQIKLLWMTGFNPLLLPAPGAGEDFMMTFWKLSITFAVISFVFGSIYGLFKRNWNILALLLLFVPYLLVHLNFPSPQTRYYMPVFWLVLLMCLYGLQGVWRIIDKNGRAPAAVKAVLQAFVMVAAVIWLVVLVRYLPQLAQASPRAETLPYAAIGLVALVFVGRILFFCQRYFLRELSIVAIMCLIIVSNQFILIRTIGNGQKDREFKELADWYVANAKPGEKLGLYMAEVVRIFAQKYADDIVYLPKAENPEEFLNACYEQDITYVAWATREGLSNDHIDYKRMNLDRNIAMLMEPRNIGPYQFVGRVGSQRRFINVFRLLKPQQAEK
ncbi:MAG: hypothetical protein JW749_05880 [Sedimentisphaerales bacterium]|nr:hypothetical protein [Sedimentisphaerales bacterium]